MNDFLFSSMREVEQKNPHTSPGNPVESNHQMTTVKLLKCFQLFHLLWKRGWNDAEKHQQTRSNFSSCFIHTRVPHSQCDVSGHAGGFVQQTQTGQRGHPRAPSSVRSRYSFISISCFIYVKHFPVKSLYRQMLNSPSPFFSSIHSEADHHRGGGHRLCGRVTGVCDLCL